MAGHSKWANIKHRKGAADAKRGKIFSKLAKEIMISARDSGGDPGSNITLRTLVGKARSYNMPADNITRAIKKGTGELEGQSYDEIVYEAYAPGGVAMIVQCLTDNKNRTASDVRHAITKNGGSMGGSGSVVHMFSRKGIILVSDEAADEEKLMDVALEAGAEDLKTESGGFEITTETKDYHPVVEALEAAGIETVESEIKLVASILQTITDVGEASKLLKYLEMIDDLDDVQNVYTNIDIPDDVMEQVEAEG